MPPPPLKGAATHSQSSAVTPLFAADPRTRSASSLFITDPRNMRGGGVPQSSDRCSGRGSSGVRLNGFPRRHREIRRKLTDWKPAGLAGFVWLTISGFAAHDAPQGMPAKSSADFHQASGDP